jgi:hypothetical protein
VGAATVGLDGRSWHLPRGHRTCGELQRWSESSAAPLIACSPGRTGCPLRVAWPDPSGHTSVPGGTAQRVGNMVYAVGSDHGR